MKKGAGEGIGRKREREGREGGAGGRGGKIERERTLTV